jgi:hypothetical protein
VRKALLKVPGQVLLIEAIVRREEYSRNPSYPYRQHPTFQLKVIPSLFEVDKVLDFLRPIPLEPSALIDFETSNQQQGKVVQSLIDEDCSEDSKLGAFIQSKP